MPKTRILFVDDEPNVLDGLRRMLRRHARDWDTVFVGSAAAALEQLAQAPFDVIVTDFQMPGMNGAELLESVMKRYPHVARIVLSGHTDERHATRVLKLAHQFLAKPVDASALQEAVAHACAALVVGPSQRARSIAAAVGSLPSPPDIYLDLARTAASEDCGVREIGAIIARDPALSAKMLQLVNSSWFGLGRRVSSIDHAVALLGLVRIKSLVMSAQILDQFTPGGDVHGFSLARYLQRSLMTAQMARVLSQLEEQKGDRPDQAFAAGLLHDVGLLVLADRCPEKLGAALRQTADNHVPLCTVEQELLGVTHPEVGACLLELWSLPPRIVEGVTLHHRPNETTFAGVSAVTTVHCAAALWAEHAPPGPGGVQEALFAPALDTDYLTRIGRLERLDIWRETLREELALNAGQPA